MGCHYYTCPGISQFFDEVLDTDLESNEVYIIPMPDALVGVPCDFWQIVSWFHRKLPHPDTDGRDDPVIPIGVRLAIRDRDPKGCLSCKNESRPNIKIPPQSQTVLHPSVADFCHFGCSRFTSTDYVIVLADEDPEGNKWLHDKSEVGA